MGYHVGKNALRKVENLRGVAKELFQIAVSSFKWEGLPDGLPSWMLERYLYDGGKAAAFLHNGNLMILPCMATGQQDVYYMHTRYVVYGLGFQQELDADDCVVIYNDSTHLGSWEMVKEYSTVINEINSTDRLNIKQLRVPYIFGCDENTANSVKAAITRVENDEIFVVASESIKAMLKDGFTTATTGVSFLGDDLKKHRDDIYNEVLTKLGIDNLPVSKKERLVSEEADCNKQQVLFFREDRLKARTEAAEAINKKFGTSISVKWNIPTPQVKDETKKTEKKEDKE